MTREDYCSYELSKLLKEKGFDGKCIGCYWDSKKTFDINYELLSYSDGDLRDEVILAPTHQMAMKWLREYPRYIDIGIEVKYLFTDSKYYYHIRCNAPKREIDKVSKSYYNTYEEAVEAAIKYSLENLI